MFDGRGVGGAKLLGSKLGGSLNDDVTRVGRDDCGVSRLGLGLELGDMIGPFVGPVLKVGLFVGLPGCRFGGKVGIPEGSIAEGFRLGNILEGATVIVGFVESTPIEGCGELGAELGGYVLDGCIDGPSVGMEARAVGLEVGACDGWELSRRVGMSVGSDIAGTELGLIVASEVGRSLNEGVSPVGWLDGKSLGPGLVLAVLLGPPLGPELTVGTPLGFQVGRPDVLGSILGDSEGFTLAEGSELGAALGA